jgi:hypothetical protein
LSTALPTGFSIRSRPKEINEIAIDGGEVVVPQCGDLATFPRAGPPKKRRTAPFSPLPPPPQIPMIVPAIGIKTG